MSRTVHFFLVDDDDVDVMGMKRAFQRLRIINPIHVARDGIEALERLRDPAEPFPRPFVMLVDLNMPRMSGLELIEAIRNDPELSDAIIFAVTTSADQQDRDAAARLDIAGYVVKSDAQKDVMAIIERLDHYWRVVEMP